MASFFQGSPLPSVTTTTDKQQTAPGYYTDYLTKLSQTGQTALGRTAAEGVAGYDPLQDTGYGQYEAAAGAYRPGLTAAGQTAAGVARGIDTNRINQFMDPYRQNVVDEMARLSQQNLQKNVMPTLKAGFVGSGGLGGQRYAGALGQALTEAQQNLTGQQYGALSAGYQNALKAALDESQLQNQAAQTQAKIAEQEQALGLTGAGALTKAGAERQKYEQTLRDYPLANAANVSALLRNYQIPLSEYQKQIAPGRQDQFAKSPFEVTGGILSLIGGLSGGQSTPSSGLISIWNKAKEMFGVTGNAPSSWDDLMNSIDFGELDNYSSSRPDVTSTDQGTTTYYG
ncbi:MAG: hypothetical protein FGM60_04450 [Candidatus Planktophila sp.]|nr:hypothetical protein [Candidatus Planktophila sp.]